MTDCTPQTCSTGIMTQVDSDSGPALPLASARLQVGRQGMPDCRPLLPIRRYGEISLRLRGKSTMMGDSEVCCAESGYPWGCPAPSGVLTD